MTYPSKLLKRAVQKLIPSMRATLSEFQRIGFHGDRYLLLSRCAFFVETGTHVGSTSAFVARTYPDVSCLSCEPSRRACRRVARNVRGLENARVYNEDSRQLEDRCPAILA